MKRKVDIQERRYFGGQVKALDTATRTMEVVANSGEVDRYNERVPAGSLEVASFLQNPVVMWAHNYQEPPVGKATGLRADGDALLADIQFAETEQAEDIYQLYKGGFLSAVSIGFRGMDYEPGKKGEPLTWTKAELIEISCVPIPADAKALARRVKMLTNAVGEGELWPEQRPYPNEHACRLLNPDDCEPGSFRRMKREHEGKSYGVIMARLKGEDTLTEQAYRYPTDTWEPAEARTHCNAHDGKFEAAAPKGKAMTNKDRGAMQDCMEMCDRMAAMAEKMKASLGGMMEDEEEEDMPMKPKGIDGKAAEDILAALKGVGEAITKLEVTA